MTRRRRGWRARSITRYGRPDIFNTDQGLQFTTRVFTATLKDACIHISMDDFCPSNELWYKFARTSQYQQKRLINVILLIGPGSWECPLPK